MHQVQALQAIVRRVTGTDSTSERVRSILTRIESEATALAEMMSKPDPMKSTVANDLLVNAEKARLRTLVAESQAKLTQLISGFRTAQDAARIAKARLAPDGFAREIRTAFRTLDSAGKRAFMGAAIKSGDASTIAAIVTAPRVLSGLTDEEIAHYREAYLEQAAPRDTELVDEMQAICDTAVRTAEDLARPSVAVAA